jgi:demethylmenaquinone methyltransferase/2-methoxy-6-polyprenyl-1,4-benzoquinol methylase
MFDRIARRYDRLNRVLSLGLDRRWRRGLVRSVGPLCAGEVVLDIATGTADVALALARAYPGVRVLGLDPSEGMLEVGEAKILSAGLEERIDLIVGDARELPLGDDHVAGVTIAFGIRNVPDRLGALEEMVRVTRPGGRVSVLELGSPTSGFLAPLARAHIHHVVPRIGRLVAGGEAYRYLQESIAAFPSPGEFADLMARAGLVDVMATPQTFATATLYTGRVPEAG